MKLQCADKTLDLSTPQVMGILNITPDSFSDGGQFFDTNKTASISKTDSPVDLEKVLQQAESMVQAGASILDIGGESTRPGAAKVSSQQEMDRVLPVLEKIKHLPAVVSIDTSNPVLMSEAIKLGAGIINDVRALQKEGALETVANSNVAICLMHMQGDPQTMQNKPEYQKNIIEQISDFFDARIQACEQAGIRKQQLILDPGFGFGKTLEHNVELLKSFNEFEKFNLPLLAGISRKSMLGLLTEKPVTQRVAASVTAAVLAISNGAHIVRVHDVDETVDAVKVCNAVMHT